MESRHLDLAAEFCQLVGKPHLLDYLGLPESASPEALQKKLKARRKYMQGMQSNPKYRHEALFLIKNFKAMNAVLASPIPYVEDARRRAESQHLPVLEMTIKGVLAGGSLNYDQEDYLRRNALELGVSEASFEEVLSRLASAAGVPRATADVTVTPDDFTNLDFYRTLGVPRHASRDEIYARYRARTEECKAMGDASQRDATRTRIEKAWKVLSDEATRQQYDLSWTRTGPPARNRENTRPIQSSTAPPVQPRAAAPRPPPSAPFANVAPTASSTQKAPAKLELLSQPKQTLHVSATPVTVSIEVRNAGELPLHGEVTASHPWLKVLTTALKPDAKQQAVRVQIDPARLEGRSTGFVEVATKGGEQARVEFDVVPKPAQLVAPALLGGGLAVVLLLVVGVWFAMSGSDAYEIRVDPWATEVLIDGRVVGKGHRIVLDEPPLGEATVTVRHPNFRPWVKDVLVEGGATLEVDLALDAPMDFRPTPELKVADLDHQVAVTVMEAFQSGLDRCLRSGVAGPNGVSGVVRIYVGKEGRAIGYDLEGSATDSPAIRECLRRQTAGPLFPPLANGDYATVRYDFSIPSR